MVELTDREKKIILIKYIIHGTSPFADSPLSVRETMLKAALKTMGYDEAEMLDIGEAIIAFQKEVNDRQIGFIRKNKGFLDNILNNMSVGNEVFKL